MRVSSTALLVLLVACIGSAGCQRQSESAIVANENTAKKIRESFDKAAETVDAATPEQPAQERTGWATLKGRFVVVGTPPQPAALKIGKDPNVCAPEEKAVLSGAIRVGSDGELANVLLFVRDLEGEDMFHESAAPGKTEQLEFDQKECVFLTRIQVMQVTQSLLVKNSDPVGHNTDITGMNFNFTIPSGGAQVFKPAKARKKPVKVSCSVHPWMLGHLIPLEHSYSAVTGEDGSFEIKNLPAGVELKLQVWHEAIQSKNLTGLGAGGTWKRGVWSLPKLEPDEVREVEIEIPAASLKSS